MGVNETVQVTLAANMDVSQVLSGVKAIQSGFNGLKIDPKIMGDLTKEFNNLQGYIKDFQKIMGKESISKADIKNLQNLEKSITSSFSTISKMQQQLSNTQIMSKVDSSQLDKLVEKTKIARNALNDAFSNIKFGDNSGILQLEAGIEKAVGRSKTLKSAFQDAFSDLKTGNIDQFVGKIDKAFGNLENKLHSGKLETTALSLIKTFQQLGLINIDVKTDTARQKIDALKLGFDGIKQALASGTNSTEIQKLIQDLEKAITAEENFRTAALQSGQVSLDKLATDHEKIAQGAERATKAEREFQQATLSATTQVQQLQQSTQYFFSLRNMINLLKRGIREAITTVQDLDKAMTETAVVTTFDVSDMWAKLPEYTANANALGATVQDMYESTTLYYQQGLNTQQAMSIATETMKMARIGGLEAADATDKMTAALRGFNMEINEASAQRINDVYSNLAAKTASNTEELGTAMQRTASIAASAGMSFEGTAAFLAQAIETTREPAENLGTAMKTIVARFQELKKNPLEIAEVDGEEVSYNKVDTALQSIGVSLKDTNGQFRALDEVFLEISQRWDSLTQTQQRYIATTAAGSRQQSRFIAMMSDYERTMQLMDYANNSAGASEEQFGKTLESLEAKINKLKNAWKEFLMGIMNDSFTKGIVDGATQALGMVNKLIDTLSFGSKGLQSVLSIVAAFTTLKAVGRGANALIGGLGGIVDPKSSWKEGFSNGIFGGQAAKFSSPIVKAIYSLIPHIDGRVNQQQNQSPYKFQDYGNYRNARKQLTDKIGGLSDVKSLDKLYGTKEYSINDLTKIINSNKLNEAQQKAFFQSSPGLKKNLTNNLSQIMQKVGADPKVSKGLIDGFNKGTYRLDEVLEKGGLTTTRLKTAVEKQGLKTGQTFKKSFAKPLVKEKLDESIYKSVVANGDKAKELLGQSFKLSEAEKAANTFGKVGAGVTQLGMSMQMLGSQISTVNPAIGQLVTQLGSLLTTAGSIPNLFASLVAGGPGIWAITAGVTALGAAFVAFQKKQQKIKQDAEDITTNFKDTHKQTQENIASLKAYREELATLSKGVDRNGNNINLSDADYERYLEIIDDIATINPAIVEGYNAQGHAIIANNAALEKTLQLQQDIQKKATDKYLEVDSLEKLLAARNINKDYRSNTTIGISEANIGRQSRRGESFAENWGSKVERTAPMFNNIKKVIDQLQSEEWFDSTKQKQLEQQFGVSFDNLTNEAVKKLYNHKDQFTGALSNIAAESGEAFSDELTNSIDKWGENQAAFEEAIQPVYEWLSTYLNQNPLFKDLPEEIRPALQSGLKAIAGDTALTAKQMTTESRRLLNNFNNLTIDNKKYQESLKAVEDAQSKFADTLNETEYKAEVQPAIDNLNKLKEQAENMGTVAGDSVAEFLENQIAQISNFAEEGAISLGEALNTAIDDIAAAEGALEDFNKATERDFWTASEGMKSIYDKIFETYKDSYGTEYEKHTEGLGDATFWEGAKQLLSEKELTGGIDAVSKKLKDLEPILRDGQEGVEGFLDLVAEHSTELEKLTGVQMEDGWFKNIPEEQWGKVAEELGISENLLTSMLNKARQFGLIDFDNLSKVREALATSDNVLQGTSVDDSGKKSLYVKEDTLRAELSAAGYNDKDRQDAEIAKLQKEQNVQTIKTLEDLPQQTAESLIKDELQIKDFPELVNTLSKTGDYSKEEIIDMAEKAGFGTENTLSDNYDEIIQALESPELAEQTSQLQSIGSQLSAIQALIANNGSIKDIISEGAKAKKESDAEIYGNNPNRVDNGSVAEMFSIGKNTNGEFLTQGEFAAIREQLGQTQQKFQEQAQAYQNLAETANNPAEKEALLGLAQDSQDKSDYIGKLVERGELEHSKLQEIAETEKAKQQALKEKERSDWEKSNVNYEDYANARQAERDALTTDSTADNQALAQQYVNNLQQSVAGAFDNINPAVVANNPAMLGAAEILTQAIAGKITDPALMTTALGQLGVEQGSVGYESFFKYVTDLRTAMGDNAQQAADEAMNQSESPAVFGKHINNNAILEKLGISQLIDNIGEGLSNFEAPDTSNFTSQVQTQLKTWWENLTKTPETPQTQSQTQAQTTQSVSQNQQTAVQSQEIVQKFKADTAELDVAKTKIEAIQNAASQPATIRVHANVGNATQEALSGINQIKDATQGSNIIKVAAKVSGSKEVSNLSTVINQVKPKVVNIRANVNGLSSVQNLKNSIDKLNNKTITVTTIKKTENRAKGAHNHGYAPAPPKAGSAARGGYGQLGPKGKGGLTLTGELGYEVAWLPSENRSMILGANGPQMINLPGDAVVWTHEQSKKILSQKSIPAGSHAATANGSKAGFKRRYSNNSGGSSQGSGGNSKGSNSSKGSKDNKKASDAIVTTTAAISKTVVWWDNIARRAEETQRRADKNQKTYEKYLKNLQATLKTTGTIGKGNDFISNTQKAISIYQEEFNRAKKELENMDKGTARQRKAKKTKSKKDDKKANKAAFNNEMGGAVQVSYSTGKGKNKKTKNAIVSTAEYIQEKDGTYIINQKKLNKIKNKEKRKAVADALNKEINDRISKRNKAQDDIEKAQEALEKFGEQLYETFFAWETELTKIWNITQKIEQAEENLNRQKAYGEFLTAQLNSGLEKATEDFNKQSLNVFKTELKQEVDILKQRSESLKTLRDNVQKAISIEDEQKTLEAVQSRLNATSEAEAELNAKQKALDDAKARKTKAQKAADAAKKELKAAKKQQKAAKKTKGKKDDKKAANAVKEAQKKLDDANKALKNAESAVSTAQEAFNQANNAFKSALENNTIVNETEKLGYEAYAKELQEQISLQNDASRYLDITKNADGTVSIDFNSDLLEEDKLAGLLTGDKVKKIEEYVKNIQDSSKELNEGYLAANEALTGLYNRVSELKDKWADYAKELWDYAEQKSKEDVDNFKKLSSAITNALKKLLEEVKRKIDDRRKTEDNAKTEAEISKKQQRLAILQADTSGGHQVEIAQLQKEIADAQQDYQRSLEDQLLDKLQQQADLAAEQRERLIELAEAQLEVTNNAALVDMWMESVKNEETRYDFFDDIYEAYKVAKEYEKSPQEIKNRIDEEFQEFWNGLATNQDEQEAVIEEITKLTDLVEKIKKYLELSGLNIKNAKDDYHLTAAEAQAKTGATWADVREKGGYDAQDFANAGVSYEDARKAFEISELKEVEAYSAQASEEENKAVDSTDTEASVENVEAATDTEAENNKRKKEEDYRKKIKAAGSNGKTSLKEINEVKKIANAAGYGARTYLKDLAATKLTWVQILTALKGSWSAKRLASTFSSDSFKKAFDKVYGKGAYKKNNGKGTPYAYKTGGLADYTGPAWLDGTPSKPELVLDAQDTKNFIALKDILSRVMGVTSDLESGHGDMIYEVNINVEKLTSDYDVDRVAERVKKIIVKDSNYRNINQVRKFR